MSFMDKVKAQAEQAMVKGQQAVQQGQTKLGEMQAAKGAGGSNDHLLRDLGAAYYAEQRAGGSSDATANALAALDAHAAAAAQQAAAAQAAADQAAAQAQAGGTPAPSIIDGMTPPAGPATPAAPSGPAPSFGLDDV